MLLLWENDVVVLANTLEDVQTLMSALENFWMHSKLSAIDKIEKTKTWHSLEPYWKGEKKLPGICPVCWNQ